MNEDFTRIGDELLRGLEAICDRLMTQAGNYPGYAETPIEQIRPMTEAALRWFITGALLKQIPLSEEVAAHGIEARLRMGVPVQSFLEALPVIVNQLWIEAVAVAREIGVGSEALTELGSIMLGGASMLANQAARVNQRVQEETVRTEERRRTELLDALLVRGASPSDLGQPIREYGLDADKQYFPFRARALLDANSLAMELVLREQTRNSGGIYGMLRGDLCGILSRPPSLDGTDALIGVGPMSSLSFLPAAFLLQAALSMPRWRSA